MNDIELAALFQLADRAPKTGAETLWLAQLRDKVQKQLDAQTKGAQHDQEKDSTSQAPAEA